ncbi:phosphoglycerate dehydrogenase [Candidatus Omnitrophota bacterium]
MFKVLVSDKLAEDGLNVFKGSKEFKVDVITGQKPEELKKNIKGYDAVIVRSATKLTKEIIEAADKLKVIGRAGVGLDNIDLDAATKKGVIVMNTPGGNTMSTAEHTLSLILALSRNIPQANASLKQGQWKRSKFMGVEVYRKTLGIIGLGRIGKEVAKRSLSFGMKVLAYDPFLSAEVAKSIGIETVALKDLFKRSDYITVHTPLTNETRHLVSAETIALMKKDARIINCARGGIVDEQALAKAVKEERIAGAAIDVYEKEPLPPESELLSCDNIITTPHLGASTEEAQVNVAIEVAQAVRDALLGKGIRNAANYPSLETEVYKILEPYIELSEKLGLFLAQLVDGRYQELNIYYSGEIIQHDWGPLTMALVKGVLSPALKDTVNFVNATSIAKERGIKIKEIKSSSEEEFITCVKLELKSDKEKRSVTGTLAANRKPRIVKIDGYYVEASPVGDMLVIKNWDKAGVIGGLGSLLSKQKINIAAMSFGREKPGGKAISVLNVDAAVSSKLAAEIKGLKHVLAVKVIRL